MKVQQEFSKSAKYYDGYNIIQEQVAEKLVSWIDDKPKNILDIGCGSGAVYKKIDWQVDRFTGIDFSSSMLKTHPRSNNVVLLNNDFNDSDTFKQLLPMSIDCIIASSSLQWAKNIREVFSNLSLFNAPMYFAIFTSNTFDTLNKTANITSILSPKQQILRYANQFSILKQQTQKYTLHFDSKRKMLNYIKKSGVSGNRNILTFKQIKKLMLTYPLDYLEFEIIFLHVVT